MQPNELREIDFSIGTVEDISKLKDTKKVIGGH